MKKLSLLLVFLLLMTSVLAGCGGNTDDSSTDNAQTDTPEKVEKLPDDAPWADIYEYIQMRSDNPDKVTIRYASMASEETLVAQPYTRGYVMFLKQIKEELGDKIEIQFLLNSTIGGTADAVLGGLQMGNIELTDWPLTSCAEYTNAFMPLDVPYMVTSFDGMVDLLDGPAGDLMKKKFLDDTNLKVITYGVIGPRHMTNNKRAITSVDDMEGLKMRVQSNKLHMLGLESLGASATNISFSELFTALQQGTVDGQENPADTILNHNFHEVQDYLTVTSHLVTVAGLVVNNDWYNDLDPEIQAAFEKAATESFEYGQQKWHEENDAVLGELGELMEVTYLTDEAAKEFQEAAKSAWPKMFDIIGEDYFKEFIDAAGMEID